MRDNNSKELLAADEKGGIIQHVCEASATFCARLETKALETSASAPKRAAKPGKPGVTREVDTEEKKRKEAPQVRHISNAPPPPTELSGTGGWKRPSPKPTQIPPDLPNYYPNDVNLRTQTKLIFAEAARKFPEQTQIPESSKWLIAQMTPHFRSAVQAGTARADQVLSDSGMGGLLHFWRVYNCDSDIERFQLEQEARKSDEWLKLAQEMANVAEQQSGSKSGRGEKEALETSASAEQSKKPSAASKQHSQPLRLEDPKVRQSYSQEEAGRLLICGTRWIREKARKHKLSRSSNGRIVNDEKLKAEYGARHNPVKYP
jgi:hypothetical protein